jgi:hypothetical protein
MRPRTVVVLPLAIALGSLLFGGLVTALVLWLNADMREQTHLFLGHVRAGRDDEGYALTTAAFQRRVPADVFGAYLDARAPGVRASSGEWVNGSTGGLSETCVEVWLDDAPQGTVYVLLLKEDGLWRVNDVTHVEAPACQSD